LPVFSFENQFAKDLAYNQSILLKKDWKTFNILGLDLDFSQKDKIGALWNTLTIAGKATVKYLNSEFRNPTNKLEAIRVVPKVSDLAITRISLAPYKNSVFNTDKYTIIIAQNGGGEIGVKFNSGSGFGFNGYKELNARYSFLKNSILYGAARKGSTWRGVKITFK